VLGQDLPWLDARAQRPIHLPVVLTRDKVRRLLERLVGPSRLIALLLYGAGLRLLEAAQLRVKDVDFATNQFRDPQWQGREGPGHGASRGGESTTDGANRSR